ncbi:unnamed protein product [Rotaria sp. Silwood1]|nr:unnamed protein product [Rotaria sp. Silwood1]
MDIDDRSIVPMTLPNRPNLTTLTERFPNLHRRLPILPCYPTKDNQLNDGDPLLPNIARMSCIFSRSDRNHAAFETIEIIDLCTPTMDIDDRSIVPMTLPNRPNLTTLTERFPNLHRRLPILPCYPTKDNQLNDGDPLLPNIAQRFPNLHRRLPILPCYPTKDNQLNDGDPLLPNIAPHQLTQTELIRRRTGGFKPACHIIDNDPTTASFLRDKYHMYFGDLLERLKVDLSILDYNYTRLNQFMRMLAYEQMRVFNIQAQEIQRINEKEYPIALEFFLKFDVNLFYMKTCSFRHARPRTLNEGLFCVQEPEARYELAACGNCGLCYPQYDMRYRSKKSIVEFAQAHTHTFVNGYQAILNCSATCHTRNIIYVLTCPCGKYDYVGATMYSLQDRLMKHREHGNRIIHEFLIGQKNVLRDLPRGKTKEVIAKDRMKLYQHSARCPVAMQIFLDANPQYWRFVPMTLEESQRPEQQSIEQPVISDEPNWTLRSKGDCRVCVEAVPKPLNGYTFSNRQIMLQTQYFHKLRDKTLPNQDIDLYNASIVAVLPESCSDMFRFTIESLFITYADAKLNSIGNVLNENQNGDHYPMNDPWFVRNSEWCQGLLRRPEPRNTIST